MPKHRGVSLTKKVQLYSRTSGHFVQIREKEVDACGIKGSSYGKSYRRNLIELFVRAVMI